MSTLPSETPSSWTLKVEFDGDVRRVCDWFCPADGVEPSVLSTKELTGKLFGMSAEEARLLRLEYQDADGGHHELTDDNLSAALRAADTSRVFRVKAGRVSSGGRPEVHRLDSPRGEPEMQGAPVRHDFGVGLPQCDACGRWPILNRGCAECEARLCIDCFPQHVCGSIDGSNRRSFRERVDTIRASISETLPEVRQHLESARDVTVDSLNAFGERHSAASSAAAERISQTTDRLQQRLSAAQPGISSGVEHFKQQVANDFHTTRQDMVDAFHGGATAEASGNTSSSSEERPRPGEVAATVVGALATTALVPLRVARLAVVTVNAVASAEAPSPEDNMEAQSSTQTPSNIAASTVAHADIAEASEARSGYEPPAPPATDAAPPAYEPPAPSFAGPCA